MDYWGDHPTKADLISELARLQVEAREAREQTKDWRLAFFIALFFLVTAAFAQPVLKFWDTLGL